MRRLSKIFLSTSVFLLLLAGYFQYISSYTQDLGRHLLTGKIILKTLSVPKINLFSYTNTNFPFINHHFLSEVIFYIVFSVFGNNGLQILTVILIAAAFSIIYFYASKRYSYLITSVISFLYLGILFERNDIRPELFSFLFLSIFVVILFKNREKSTKLIYLLPAIAAIWVNTHIYFFVGLFILVLFCVDAFFQRKEIFKQLCIILGLCIVAILLNPNFLSGAIYPFKVFNNYGYKIEENQSIFFLESLGFQKTSVVYLKISVFFLFLTLIFNYKKARVIDFLLAVTFTYASFIAVRNLPLFVFATFIPFAKNLNDACLPLARKINKQYSYAFLIIVIIIFGAFLLQIKEIISANKIGFGVTPGAERGVDFFEKQSLKGAIFNNFDIGSYLIYRLYPKEKVFVDGRPEAYPAGFLQNIYIPMQEDIAQFGAVDKKYDFQTIFITHTDMTPWTQKFLGEIIRDKKWVMVYLDETSVILVKNNKENNKVISNFGMEYPKISESTNSLQDMQSLMKLANFFQLTGITDKQIVMYKKIIVVKPTFCPAIYNLAVLLSQKNDPTFQLYELQYKTNCMHSVLGR